MPPPSCGPKCLQVVNASGSHFLGPFWILGTKPVEESISERYKLIVNLNQCFLIYFLVDPLICVSFPKQEGLSAHLLFRPALWPRGGGGGGGAIGSPGGLYINTKLPGCPTFDLTYSISMDPDTNCTGKPPFTASACLREVFQT